MIIELDMLQTAALGIAMLALGEVLLNLFPFFKKYCIPAPILGGVLFSIFNLVLKELGIAEFLTTDTLEKIAMTMFFTSIGFTASFRVLKKGGFKVFLFLIISTGLIFFQNGISIYIAKMLNMNPLIGLATGSIPLTGGLGTAGSFGPELVKHGAQGANTIAIAAATFGLVAGSMTGGPLARRLINKHKLTPEEGYKSNLELGTEEKTTIVEENFYQAVFLILFAMGLGTLVSNFFVSINLKFPSYIGAMLVGSLIRNLADKFGLIEVPEYEINIVGGVSLSLFLSMALISLRLWELVDLAIPFLIMLMAQVILMVAYAYFITFNAMGRTYEAAVLAAGHCGFGLGATSNGIANMKSVTEVYGPSPGAFFILPIVGGLFVDFFNAGIIAIFINLVS